jgi:coatomer subunit beta
LGDGNAAFSHPIFDWSFPFVVFYPCRSALEGDCGFLAANLYAKSVFGEDALVNLSVEKQTDGKLNGFIRIRSKTQGIALSLGDKITLKQKGSV